MKNCKDCAYERKEYGVHSCAAHYDAKKDNARAIRQTGRGISDGNKVRHFFKVGGKTPDGKGYALQRVSQKTYKKNKG